MYNYYTIISLLSSFKPYLRSTTGTLHLKTDIVTEPAVVIRVPGVLPTRTYIYMYVDNKLRALFITLQSWSSGLERITCESIFNLTVMDLRTNVTNRRRGGTHYVRAAPPTASEKNQPPRAACNK